VAGAKVRPRNSKLETRGSRLERRPFATPTRGGWITLRPLAEADLPVIELWFGQALRLSLGEATAKLEGLRM
jgi:hypothetical protein